MAYKVHVITVSRSLIEAGVINAGNIKHALPYKRMQFCGVEAGKDTVKFYFVKSNVRLKTREDWQREAQTEGFIYLEEELIQTARRCGHNEKISFIPSPLAGEG